MKKEGAKNMFADIKQKLTGDTVYVSFAGVFTLIGFLTILSLVLTANFLTEQVRVMTEPVSNVDVELMTQTELNTEAVERTARALGLEDPDL